MNGGPTAEQDDARTSDAGLTRYHRAIKKFEFATVTALQVLVILTVGVAGSSFRAVCERIAHASGQRGVSGSLTAAGAGCF